MKVTIVGFKIRSYTDKSTGEIKELIDLYFTKESHVDNSVGVETGTETIMQRSFPKQFDEIRRAGEKIIGKQADISKDVRTYNNKSFAVIDDFQLLA